MAATGTIGVVTAQDDLFIEGAPYIYYQEYTNGFYMHNPDSDNYYWGLSGTASNPVYSLGCYEDVQLGEEVTVNQVRCDRTGDQNAIVKRDRLTLSFTLKSFTPLPTLKPFLRLSDLLTTAPYEKAGLGSIDNNEFYRFYLPAVYDEDADDYVAFTLHRARIVDAFTISFTYGEPWNGQVTVQGFADTTLPNAQRFATVIRHDPSLIT